MNLLGGGNQRLNAALQTKDVSVLQLSLCKYIRVHVISVHVNAIARGTVTMETHSSTSLDEDEMSGCHSQSLGTLTFWMF